MTYTISIEPSRAGQLTATSTNGHTVTTTTPLLDGARYWLNHGANPDATITTIWSSGSTNWSLRSTIGHAAILTVEDNSLGKPVFRRYRDRRQTSGIAPYNS